MKPLIPFAGMAICITLLAEGPERLAVGRIEGWIQGVQHQFSNAQAYSEARGLAIHALRAGNRTNCPSLISFRLPRAATGVFSLRDTAGLELAYNECVYSSDSRSSYGTGGTNTGRALNLTLTSCEAVGGVVEGEFSGTCFNDAGQSLAITNGRIRAIRIAPSAK